jgi:hypothetical protein
VAVTDHNEIEGALRLREMAPFQVIVGEEVQTAEGEIIGLFLVERIPPFLSPEEAIAAIRAQDGLVYLPHPFAGEHRETGFSPPRLEELASDVDIVEVFNARNRDPACNQSALEFALRYDIAAGAGSDAHSPFEIGNAYVEMEPFTRKDQFLDHLKGARVSGHRTSFLLRMLMNHIVRNGIRRAITPFFRA